MRDEPDLLSCASHEQKRRDGECERPESNEEIRNSCDPWETFGPACVFLTLIGGLLEFCGVLQSKHRRLGWSLIITGGVISVGTQILVLFALGDCWWALTLWGLL
ncbi:MAG: hypothetical protein ACHQQS_11530 [Thermoanaerobaculales bacterium]